jgi:hypothetical protein
MHRPALLELGLAQHPNVRHLQRWRLSLTRQRKHLVHGDPGSDRCITQAGLANRSNHPLAPERGRVSQDGCQLFFWLGYLDSLACPDCAHSVRGNAMPPGDVLNLGVGFG